MNFFTLTPEKIIEAIELLGHKPTGRVLALNSVENRVFEAELDNGEFIVLKFYRPERWSKEQILEEHRFMFLLLEEEIPVITPLRNDEGQSLFTLSDLGLHYCYYRKQGGRLKDELDLPTLERLGRLIGRMHGTALKLDFKHRPSLYEGDTNFNYLVDNNVLPVNLEDRFLDILEELLDHLGSVSKSIPVQPIHGDLHSGNLIWRYEDVYLVDFDDCVSGPVIQDFWLLAPGRGEYNQKCLDALATGYNTMNSFEEDWFELVEPLRALRMLRFICWIHRRWSDPSFPKLFPAFGTEKYWQEQLEGFYEITDLL